MKYQIMNWSKRDKPGQFCFTVTPAGASLPPELDYVDHVAVFHCHHDPVKEEAALDLAKKVCAYLNDLDSKINDIKTLMSISKE